MSMPMANARILSIRPPPTVDASGGQTQVDAVSTSIRCIVEEPSIEQRHKLPQMIQDASEVIYVRRAEGDLLVVGAQVTYRIDGEDQVTRQILLRTGEVKDGGLSYVEVYCRVI